MSGESSISRDSRRRWWTTMDKEYNRGTRGGEVDNKRQMKLKLVVV
jgi:hypothetical protein